MGILCIENIKLEFDIEDIIIESVIKEIKVTHDVSQLGWCDTMGLFDDVCYEMYGELV